MATESVILFGNEDTSVLSESIKLFSDLSDEIDVLDKSTSDITTPQLPDGDKKAEEMVITSVKRKSTKKSQLERELETNLSPKATLYERSTPEGPSPPNTSRYGRARKQKTIADFYPTDVAFHRNSKSSKSPLKSPTKQPSIPSPTKMSSTPSKLQSTPLKHISPQSTEVFIPDKLDISSLSNDDSPTVETKIIHTPWNENPLKTPMKVYVRKDLIQRKREEKEETGSLMMNIFSPIKLQPAHFLSDSKSPSPVKKFDKSLEKQKKPRQLAIKKEKSPKDTQSKPDKVKDKQNKSDTVKDKQNKSDTVKDKQNKSDTVKPRKQSNNCFKLNISEEELSSKVVVNDLVAAPSVPVNNLSVLEDEASSSWKLGELAWARVGSHPFWPCLITRDPVCCRFVKKKTVGRSPIPVEVLHVTFFADCGRRSWLLANFLMKFEGLDHFNKTREEFTPEMKKKDPKFCTAFNISESKKSKWLSGVTEAEMLLRRPAESREQFFITMFLSSTVTTKKIVDKPKKEKKPKEKKDKNPEISLSESLFDSLFGIKAEEEEIHKKEENSKKPVQESADIIELVDDCINSIAEKSGIVKIKTQSHMDRWLLKAKQPVKKDSIVSTSITADSDAAKSNNINELKTPTTTNSDKNSVTKVRTSKISPEVVPNNNEERKTRSSKTPSEKVVTNDEERKTRSSKTPIGPAPTNNEDCKSKVLKMSSETTPSECDERPRTPKVVLSKCLSLKIAEGQDGGESHIPLKKRKLSPEIQHPSPKKGTSDKKLNISDTIVMQDADDENSLGTKDNGLSSDNENISKTEEVPAESRNNDDKEENKLDDVPDSTENTSRIASLRKRKSNVTPCQPEVDSHDSSPRDSDSDTGDSTHPNEIKKPLSVSKTTSKYDDPEFQEFLEFKRDALLDENPDLTEEYVMTYLYKAWQYGESQKSDEMKKIDDYCLVKGMAEDVASPEPKKQRRRNKEVSEDTLSSPTVVREKSSRKKLLKTSLVEEDSDFSDIEDVIKKNTICKLKPIEIINTSELEILDNKVKSEASKTVIDLGKPAQNDSKVVKKAKQESKTSSPKPEKEGDQGEKENRPSDYFMASLSVSKPSIFKGLFKEKVCEICEKPSSLMKCKGPCGGMYHLACVKKQLEPSSSDDAEMKRTKKRKKRGRKSYQSRKKNDESKTECDNDVGKVVSDCESGDDSQVDDSVSESFQNGEKPESGVVIEPHLNGEFEISPSKRRSSKGVSKDSVKKSPGKKEVKPESPLHIVTNAEDFESQLEKKMQQLMETSISQDLDLSSASSTDGDADWDNVKAGECVIVDVTDRKHKNVIASVIDILSSVELQLPDTFKCNDCQRYDIPPCFVCRSVTCSKTNSEERQKCSVPHCNKFYHLACLRGWPQTKYSTGGPSKHRKKSQPHVEAVSCPRHVCHTCVSDDPRGCRTRFSGDKLARCVKCPATYHSFTQCIPAGSRVITASQIVCPRHCDSKLSKIPYHVNTSWCFICAKGGSLICCETCPTSFHAECLKISPPEGSYICEDCETGRLPLYGELVWVKLGHYRWWPALVLHPCEVPPNIAALPHAPNQFAVRFFGDYDHYWVSSGRVFPYQEGDTGHASSKKSAVDNTFLTAVKQAQEAYDIIKNMKQRDSEEGELVSSLLPPQYVKLKVNRAVAGTALGGKGDRAKGQRCDCDPSAEHPCAPDSDCLNRMLLTECSPSVCAAGERCENQAFEKRLYPPLAPSRTLHRGWGLKLLADIKKGDFVIEYVGEVIDEAEFQRRMARRQEIRDENYYFLTLDKDRMIDAGPKGNVARFMNHSCEPNCETQKWTVNGDTRVGLFALEDIPAGSEVTFNYNLVCAGDDKKRCLCGAKRCAGFIGAKPKQDEPAPKKQKNVKVKRKNKKKLVPSPPNSSPVTAPSRKAKSSTPTTERRRLMTASVAQQVVEADDIERDIREIKKAISDVEEKQKIEEVDNLEMKPVLGESKNKVEVLNSDLNDEGHEKQINDSNVSAKPVKRKRVSLACPESEDSDKSMLDSITKSVKKRARSNSVHFSETVTYIGDADISSSVDNDTRTGSQAGNDAVDGMNPISKQNGHFKSASLSHSEDSNDLGKSKELGDGGKSVVKNGRGRSRKSLNLVDEI